LLRVVIAAAPSKQFLFTLVLGINDGLHDSHTSRGPDIPGRVEPVIELEEWIF
jgi:hypothetical protein